jgi:AP-3 complex subunit beta
VGELVRAVQMPDSVFISEMGKLRGMNETTATAKLSPVAANPEAVKRRIYAATNVLLVPSATDEADVLKFSGQTLATKALVLISVKLAEGEARLTINCEKLVIGSMLAKEIKKALEEADAK